MEEKAIKHEYRTGNTRPPKNYRGIVSFLLVAVILLCGVCSALSMMNIHLMLQLQAQEDTSVQFSRHAEPKTIASQHRQEFSGESVSSFWQAFSDLPQGVYITYVDTASYAYAAGLREGDVVQLVGNTQVHNMDALHRCLQEQYGRSVSVQLHRNGQPVVLDLILPEE